ncbi:MAG: class I SAM-dependent RNA methyltransferase [Desulfobacteraceae bacterium]|nr:MAG: class I SAM-dependent RNA methyltransferase [Desulfobacteraceae bacterium]
MEKKSILQKGKGRLRSRQKLTYLYEIDRLYFAQVSESIKDLAVKELEELGAENIEPVFRGIRFAASREVFYRVNYMSRLVSRVLAPLISFECPDRDVLYKKARTIRWEEFMTPRSTFSVYANVSDSEITHSQYAALRVKDAIADYFRDRTNKRPNVDGQDPDVGINLHIRNNEAHISIDASGAPLHKRGYREETIAAPMQETVAAAIIQYTGWDGTTPLYDPMCGSGTLLAEALMAYCRIPAGIFRKRFGFERLPDFDAGLFERVKSEAEKQIRPLPEHLICGSDQSEQSVDVARTNLMGIHHGGDVDIQCSDFKRLDSLPPGVIVTNPPYGIRLEKGKDLKSFYKSLGDFLKQRCKGSSAYIYFGEPEYIRHVGLKASWKKPLKMGGLDGRLAKYDMYG